MSLNPSIFSTQDLTPGCSEISCSCGYTFPRIQKEWKFFDERPCHLEQVVGIWDHSKGSEEDRRQHDYINWYLEQKEMFNKRYLNNKNAKPEKES